MNLYIVLTNYHVLSACAIVVKNHDFDSELLLEGSTEQEPDLAQRIRDRGWFKRVYYVDQSNAWNEINRLTVNSSDAEIQKCAKNAVGFWSEKFMTFSKIKKRYKDINIWDDHFTLGLALAYKRIPYNYYEESPGCNYRRDIFIELSKQGITNKAFAPVAEFFGLRGRYPYAKTYNYDFELNRMETGEKDRDFSIVAVVNSIKRAEGSGRIEEFISLFEPSGKYLDINSDGYEEGKKNFLLIAQHYSDKIYRNTSMIRYELSLLADYFGDGMNLWVKNHPSNYFNPIRTWFSGASFVSEKVPLELIQCSDKIKFDVIASSSSSAAAVQLAEKGEASVILFQNSEDGDSFYSKKRFLDLHRYYVALKIIKAAFNNTASIVGIGTEANIVNNFIKTEPEFNGLEFRGYRFDGLPDIDCDGRTICLIDRLSDSDNGRLIQTFNQWFDNLANVVAFFLNEVDLYELMFLRCNEVTDKIYPIPIDITALTEENDLFGYGNTQYPLTETREPLQEELFGNNKRKERQMIYMYTTDKEVVRTVLSQKIERKLAYCGIELECNPLELNYREIVLQSTLKQLERQYLELEEKLRQTVEAESDYAAMSDDEILAHMSKLTAELMRRKTNV